MPPEVVRDLSSITKMITTGVVDEDLLQHKIGKVDHLRWLSTGNRFQRLWVPDYGLAGNDLRNLRVIVQFLASHTHTQNLIQSLLSSDKESDRRVAIEKLTSYCNGCEFGDKAVRPFIPPKLNWNAYSLHDILDWSNLTERLITTFIAINACSHPIPFNSAEAAKIPESDSNL